MFINPVRFGAIIDPVDSVTKKNHSPLPDVVRDDGNITYVDVYQPMTAEAYARHARANLHDPTAVALAGAHGRTYAFTGPDSTGVQAVLDADETLPTLLSAAEEARRTAAEQAAEIQAQIEALQRRQAAIHKQADEVADAYDRRFQALVQAYVDAHPDQVVEVPYEAHPELLGGRTLSGSIQDWFAQLPTTLRHLAHRDKQVH